MLVTDFDYDLPQELIAQHPMEPRDHSRLLVVDKKTGEIEHKHFYDLVNYLKPGDVLVFNDTRVIPARLHGTKDTGAHVEVFLLTRRDATDWEVLVRPGKKLQVGAKINFSDELSCEVIEHTDFGGRVVRFKYDGIFEEILDRLGETPLPPYITAPLEDKERYQTVYNRERGSAAAPTAGLHFTKELLQKIADRGIESVKVTLHVGGGTFLPVKVDDTADHVMHAEYGVISPETADIINAARKNGRRIVSIGTTALRLLESAADDDRVIHPFHQETSIFITPGYRFKGIDALFTNFHLPCSTLFMLVCAFCGTECMKNAYKHAIESEYRFFSYGDACFLEK